MRGQGGQNAAPLLVNEPSDTSFANFRSMAIGPPGPDARFWAVAQSSPNLQGVQDLGPVDQVNGGLKSYTVAGTANQYDNLNHPGAVVWKGGSSMPTPGNTAGGSIYGVWAVDKNNIWVLDASLGISWCACAPLAHRAAGVAARRRGRRRHLSRPA